MDQKIIHKYIAGDASQEEKEAVQLWIEADPENRTEFISLRTLYDISLAHLPEEDHIVKVAGNNRRKLFIDFIKIAAAIIITFSCTYYFLQEKLQPSGTDRQVSMQTIHVPAGQRAELTLTDGTKVWLNSLTTFTFPDYFSELSRDVYLDGEGYFEVAYEENRHFHVNTKEHVIRVFGTQFNVLSYSRNPFFETSLIDGSVEIIWSNNEEKILLEPGSRAYTENNRLIISPIRDYDYFLWKKGIITFNHERIEDILAKLELYYDIRIENSNQRIVDMRYTGKFRTKDGIEHVLNVLQVPTGLRYKKENDNNLIYVY